MMEASSPPGFSIIIPAYLEAKNIPLLIQRIAALDIREQPFEVLIVDDNSNDGTERVVAELHQQYPWLKLIIRHSDRSWSKSILEGIQHARFPVLIFMDADLSHPPESIPQMLTLLQQSPTLEMIIGSRYMEGGMIDKQWPIYRNLVSRLATLVIKPLLPLAIKDPLSGFIAVRKTPGMLNEKYWNPIGAKLGLEMIVKSHLKHIVEIPIYFGQRQFGDSKLMNVAFALRYAKQIRQLWLYKLVGAKAL
jgi:dolichol-phosphate mannosyltransferase